MKSVVILLLIASLTYASGLSCVPCPSPLACPKIGCVNGEPQKPVCGCCPTICPGRLGEKCGSCHVDCEKGLVCRYRYGNWFKFCGTCQYSYGKK
uniref:insulin-like growth factor-binding protein 1 n=1 Tax=Styela clava TaxID=7725 RepID=UPI001939EC79|nr:insulin-like growth factor-binding protein 1 [Styela clava]